MIGETYFREDFPVGSKVVMKYSNAALVNAKKVQPLQTTGVIKSYDTVPDIYLGNKDHSLHSVKILWENNTVDTLILCSIIHYQDVEAYVRQENDLRLIRFALMENFVFFSDDNMGTAEQWLNLDMPTDRKVALMHACVALKNVDIYDKLSVEELKSLKHHVRAMEGAGK